MKEGDVFICGCGCGNAVILREGGERAGFKAWMRDEDGLWCSIGSWANPAGTQYHPEPDLVIADFTRAELLGEISE